MDEKCIKVLLELLDNALTDPILQERLDKRGFTIAEVRLAQKEVRAARGVSPRTLALLKILSGVLAHIVLAIPIAI